LHPTDLGFETSAFTLWAQWAFVQGDPVAELSARHRQAQILLKDDPRSVPSLRCYARLLEQNWRIAEAQETDKQLAALGDQQAQPDRLAEHRAALDGDQWVIEADVATPEVIRAWSALDKPFVGRWVQRRLKPLPFCERRVSPQAIVQRYEQVRSEQIDCALPEAEVQTLSWITRSHVELVEAVTVSDHHLGDSRLSVQLVIQVTHDGIQSVAAPVIVIRAFADDHVDVIEHNDQALLFFKQSNEDTLATSWQARVLGSMVLALRKILTQTRAENDRS